MQATPSDFSRKPDALHPTGQISAKDMGSRMKEIPKLLEEAIRKRTSVHEENASRSSSEMRPPKKVLSKVLRNIQNAKSYPMRSRKVHKMRKLLPPVPRVRDLCEADYDSLEAVRTVCRVKPTTQLAEKLIKLEEDGKHITVSPPLRKKDVEDRSQKFRMDQILKGQPQDQVHNEVLGPHLTQALEGISSLILVHGRKGSGKRYTVIGEKAYEFRGIISRAIEQLFDEIRHRENEFDIRVSVSYSDMVGDTVLDLLTENWVSETTVLTYLDVAYVKELAYARVSTPEDALLIFFLANWNRKRMMQRFRDKPVEYHSFFSFYFEIHSKLLTETVFKVSKVTVLKLGGVTNIRPIPNVTYSVHDVVLSINKSIGLLEQAVTQRLSSSSALQQLPCRQSRLVHILKDFLTRKSMRITVLVCISAEEPDILDTISSLHFASHLKGIRCQPASSASLDKDKLISAMSEQTKMLKMELRMYDLLNGREAPDYLPKPKTQDVYRTARDVRDFVDGRTPVPKFTTYKNMENFLNLMKKLTKEGDIPADAPDALEATGNRENSAFGALENDDGKTSPQKDFFDGDGGGELDEKEGMGAGLASGGKSKNLKNLLKKKKEEKPKAEKMSVITPKKTAREKKNLKDVTRELMAASPMKDLRSDSAHPEGDPKATQAVDDALQSPVPGRIPDAPSDARLGPSPPGPAPPSTAAAVQPTAPGLPRCTTKTEAFSVFTSKISNGSFLSATLDNDSQTVAAKEKAALALTVAVNSWIDQVRLEELNLEQLMGERKKFKPQTSGEVQIVSFEEYKSANKITQLRHLIETGTKDVRTCKNDINGLKKTLETNRRKLFTEFEDWYSRTYEEPTAGDNVTASPALPANPLQAKNGEVTFQNAILQQKKTGTNTSMPVPRQPETLQETSTSTGATCKLTDSVDQVHMLRRQPYKDASERHRNEMAAFEDRSPEKAVYLRAQQKLETIKRITAANEMHNRLNPRQLKKLDNSLTIYAMMDTLPRTLSRPKTATLPPRGKP